MPNHPNKPKTGQIDTTAIPRTRAEKYVEFYTNNSEMSVSAWDCRIKFGQLREDEKGKMFVEAQSVAIMSLHHAKALALALVQSIKQYEKANGLLSIPLNIENEVDLSNNPESVKP